MGRITTETGAGATTTARALDYDPDGRVASATSPAGNLTYTYNQRGLLANATGYGGPAGYTYDAEGHLTQRVDSAGTATFTYDSAGRTATTADPLTGITATNTYNTLGRVSTVVQGSTGPTRTYTYDTLGRISTDTTTKPTTGTGTVSISHGYDNDDLLTTKTTTGIGGSGANTYGYDGMSRITSWLNPAGTTTSYGYDNASNRTTVTTPAGTRTSTYDQRNRITGTTGGSQAADAYTWNPRGQLTSTTQNGVTTTYTYDAFERLTQTQKTPGTTATYTYDSLDRVAQRNTANFAYDDLTNNPTKTPTAAGELKLLHDPLGTILSNKTGTNAASIVVTDLLHTDTNATTDPTTGDLTTSTNYDPWGNPTATTGTPPPIGYQNSYTDPDTGLVNAHARWYNPTLGTFTTRDTYTLPPTPVAATNRYLYANASPLTNRDPNGHMMARGDTTTGPGIAAVTPKKFNPCTNPAVQAHVSVSTCPGQSWGANEPTHFYQKGVNPPTYTPPVFGKPRDTEQGGRCSPMLGPNPGLCSTDPYLPGRNADGAVDPTDMANMPTYHKGDPIADPATWLQAYYPNVPIEKMSEWGISEALTMWLCYYWPENCGHQGTSGTDLLKGFLGITDAEQC